MLEVPRENYRPFNAARQYEHKIDPCPDGNGFVLKRASGSTWWVLGSASCLDGEWYVSYMDRVANLGDVSEEGALSYMWEWRGFGGVQPLTLDS